MITELYKREVLIREIESFEQIHHTVLKDFRKENKFPIPRGREGLMERILRRVHGTP